MQKITLTHDEPYSGTDHGDAGRRLDLQPGDTANVSDEKAEQLLADFPDWFKKGTARKTKASKDDEPKTYEDLAGNKLREYAATRADVQFDGGEDDDAIRAALIAADAAKA